MIPLQLNMILLNAGNSGRNTSEEILDFSQNDPYGVLMAIMGMGIVFFILLMLYLVFSNTPVIYTQEFKQKLRNFFSRKKKPAVEPPLSTPPQEDLSGEVNAAIAAAIHLYRSELHDYENTVLTISKVSRTYSPWSSKIYGLRNLNTR